MLKIDITGTAVAASLTGLGSNVTGATFTLTANDAGDSLAHLITVRNDSITDHSAKTLDLVGTDADGNALTETIAAPGASATVTSTKHFLTLTSITPSATIGTDTFDVGWAAAAVSPSFNIFNLAQQIGHGNFSMGFGCIVGTGTPTYTVELSYTGVEGDFIPHATVTGETTDQAGEQLSPIHSVRLQWAAAGQVTFAGLIMPR